MLPKVIIHNAVSADGRINNFAVDMGLYYELAISFSEDATLAGSNTILSAPDEIPKETEDALKKPEVDPEDKRPILVIPDSKGRVRIWHALKQWPYWRHFVALVSKSTPKEYLDYLDERYIDHIRTGDDHVDLKTALEELTTRYGIKKIRVDSGGILNGILLREGLVTEVSMLIHPVMVGDDPVKSIYDTPEPTGPDNQIQLKLTHFEKIKNDLIWVKYRIVQ